MHKNERRETAEEFSCFVCAKLCLKSEDDDDYDFACKACSATFCSNCLPGVMMPSLDGELECPKCDKKLEFAKALEHEPLATDLPNELKCEKCRRDFEY